MDNTVRRLRCARAGEFRSASALAAKMRSGGKADLDALDLACIARAAARRVKRVKPPKSSDA